MKPSPGNLCFPKPARFATIVALTVLAVLVFLPLLQVVGEIFFVDGNPSFANLDVVLFNARQFHLLGNSLLVSLGSAALALLFGIPFAILVTRTRFPGRSVFAGLGVLPLLIPPVITAIAWAGAFQIQGPAWAVLIFSFSYFPFVWILTARALARVDLRMEESGRLAGGWRGALRVEIPYVLPSALVGALLVFVFTVADFSVPDYLSTIGPKFSVYADDIFFRWKQENRSGEALAASIPPALLIGLALVGVAKLRRRLPPALGSRFVTPQRLELGALRIPAIVFCVALLGASAIFPLARLAYEAGGADAYLEALRTGKTDLGNSLLLSLMAALGALALQLFPALAASRSRRGALLDFAAILPLALPGLVLSIGMIRLWNRPGPWIDWGFWIYGSKAVVLMLFIARFSAFPFFTASEGFQAIAPSLEESAAVSGIPWRARFQRILFPLVLPALLSGALLVFLFSMREIDSVALIPSANSTIMFRIYNYVHFGRDSLLAALCLITVFCIAFPLLVYQLLWAKESET